MNQSERGWVIDGSYDRVLQSMRLDNATDIICRVPFLTFCEADYLKYLGVGLHLGLDTPLALSFYRILIRTLLRLFSLRPPCSPGGPQTWSEALSTKGILWWCLSHHSPVKREQEVRMRELGVEIGGKMRRIGGWGGELNNWKERVTDMIYSKWGNH